MSLSNGERERRVRGEERNDHPPMSTDHDLRESLLLTEDHHSITIIRIQEWISMREKRRGDVPSWNVNVRGEEEGR